MEKQMTVRTIRHKNVSGKELFYVELSTGDEQHMMNVGESTVVRLEAIMEGKTKKIGSNTEEKPKK